MEQFNFEWNADPKDGSLIIFDTSDLIDNNELEMAEKNQTEEKVQYSQWMKRGSNTFIPTDNSKTQKRLDAGVYNLRASDAIGIYLHKKTLNLDEIIKLPSKEADEVLDGIQTFWKRKAKFDEYGFTYKRGVLLYGVAGGGKTTIINQLCKYLVDELDGVVFYISQTGELGLYYTFTGEILRIIEPDRPVITVFEDIDGLCSYKENETTLLNILDGVNQMANVVHVATTNFISHLNERIVNRPSRFDLRVEVKYPSAEARKIYFEHKLKADDLSAIGIDKWVNATEEMTMAHLAELIKCVAILGNDFDMTVERLKQMKQLPHESEYNKETKSSVGFYSFPKTSK